ncbi:MAG TPA: hypothetical protein PLI19_00825 [Erysipelotrichaceae bacterium]|nr:hypothetical protein [Erysipelotrichaceae bacterium]HQB31849.1 hypothetical protein [Erysipelotrichaceae bacterium]
MRDTFVDVAVFYGNRRSKRNRIRFINYFRNIYNERKIKTDIIHIKQKINESFHFVIGDLENAGKVIITPLDTGSKMLLPFYRYHPADSKSNFASEILNTTVYIVLSVLTVSLMLFVNRNFNSYQLPVRVLLVVIDLIMALIAFVLLKNLDNRNNYNRNSQSIALIIENSFKNSKDCAYVLVDQTAMMNLGYQQLQKRLENKEVLILDCLGTADETMYLLASEENYKMTDRYKDILARETVLLNREQTANSPLRYFARGMILTAGIIDNARIEIADTRTSKDQKIDFERLDLLNNNLGKYINLKK